MINDIKSCLLLRTVVKVRRFIDSPLIIMRINSKWQCMAERPMVDYISSSLVGIVWYF